MNVDSIAVAVAEAERFLSRVKAWKEAQRTYTHGDHTFSYTTPRQSGALRGSSMDLTRALADMRRAG